MRTLKEHILEKLKVTPSQTIIMTNRQFFKLLKEYTNNTHTVSLMTADVFGHDVDDLPKFHKNETRYIASIQPYAGGHDQILLELKDIYEGKLIGYVEVNVKQNGNDIVNFTDNDSLTKIIKYMKEPY